MISIVASIRHSQLFCLVRNFTPHSLVNTFWHWPLALIAVIINRYPARNLTVIGITGTDGKTTTANIIYQLLRKAQIKTALISTVSAKIGDQEIDTGFHVTSPHPFKLQTLLRQISKSGTTHLVLEVTSHGLAQHRLLGCNFHTGALTNLTPEHLDYHQTLNQYLKDKAKLFHHVKFAILNADCSSFPQFQKIIKSKNPRCRILTYSLKKRADLRAKNITYHPDHINFTFHLSSKLKQLSPDFPHRLRLKLKLPGSYNLQNTLAAIGTAFSISSLPNHHHSPNHPHPKPQTLQKSLSMLPSIPGRLEYVPNTRGFNIIIDFAHTPNALEQVLQNIHQNQKTSRLITIFGCAGLRDPYKRPLMGAISAKLSDITILTAEDPRTEDVNKIINQIAQGCLQAGATKLDPQEKKPRGLYSLKSTNMDASPGVDGINKGQISNAKGHFFFRIPDRQQAISFAINKIARKGDTILITGKGHEQSMCCGTVETPWSDHAAVQNALKRKS